jgi:hypothetical protein
MRREKITESKFDKNYHKLVTVKLEELSNIIKLYHIIDTLHCSVSKRPGRFSVMSLYTCTVD